MSSIVDTTTTTIPLFVPKFTQFIKLLKEKILIFTNSALTDYLISSETEGFSLLDSRSSSLGSFMGTSLSILS